MSTLAEKEALAAQIYNNFLNEYIDSTPVDIYKEKFHAQMEASERSKLYRFLKRFPKGAALHLHWVSSGTNESLIQYLLEHRTIFYQCLQTHDKYQEGEIRYFKNAPSEHWIRMDRLLEQVGEQQYVEDLLVKISFNHADESGSSENRWKKFQAIFNNYYFGLTFFKPVAMYYHLELVKAFLEDNVQYAEFRSPFTFVYDEEEKVLSEEEVTLFFQSCREAAVQKYGKENWFGGKWIFESMRMFDREVVRSAMETSYMLQNKYKDLIIGFDLVGEEDSGHLCEYFAEDVLAMKEKAKSEGKEFDVLFHLGESNHPNNNIEVGLNIGTKRIGHGYNLIRYPEQAQKVKELDVPLEVCPASNMILGLVEDRRNHPLVYFHANNIPFVISSDDPQIFGYTGITHDFMMMVTATRMGYDSLKKVALNSIKYSKVTDEERKELYDMWNRKYEAFLDEVIAEFQDRTQ